MLYQHAQVTLTSSPRAIASAHAVNITSGEQVEAMVAEVLEKWGRVDGTLLRNARKRTSRADWRPAAANCAGVWTECPATMDIPDSIFDKDVNVNLRGIFNLLRVELRVIGTAQTRSLKSIVNIASTAGIVGWPILSIYSASKAGVMGLSKSVYADMHFT